jgi:hypothetical protein
VPELMDICARHYSLHSKFRADPTYRERIVGNPSLTGLLKGCSSSIPDEVTAMSNPTSQMSSQVTISPHSKAAYLWR